MVRAASIFLLTMLFLTSASSSRGPRTATSSTSAGEGEANATPFCGCVDDLRLRQAFDAELRSHANSDDRCRALLKALICQACNKTTAVAMDTSALPLYCATSALSPSSNTVRHDDDHGSSAVCVQKASTTVCDGVAAAHDGSDRVYCWRNNGLIWLGTVDVSDPTDVVLRVDEHPFANLTTHVSGRGLAGVAVDSTTQQVFVSYYTNEDAEGAGAGGSPSSFLVVDRVQLQASSSWTEGHQEVTFTRLYNSSSSVFVGEYGGEILTRPNSADPFLYVVSGPAQNDAQAQMLRLTPSGTTQEYVSMSGVPKLCAFDADRSEDLYCAIVEEDQEAVYVISDPDAPAFSGTPPRPTLVVGQQRSTSSSIVGGLLYRGNADKTLTGGYIYMYGSKFWVSPVPGYSTAREMRVTCSASTTSPQSCGGGAFTATVSSFAQDANKNALLLTTEGVYIVVEPTRCDAEADAEAASAWENIVAWIKKIFSNTWIKIIAGIIGSVAAGVGGYQISVHCCNKNNEGNDGHVEMGNIAGNVHIENHYY